MLCEDDEVVSDVSEQLSSQKKFAMLLSEKVAGTKFTNYMSTFWNILKPEFSLFLPMKFKLMVSKKY